MNFKNKIFFLSVFILLFSCNQNPLDIEPASKNLGIGFINLDSVFVHSPEDQLLSNILASKLKPEEIVSYELGYCLGVGDLLDSGTIGHIKQFENDGFIQRIEKRISEKFPSLKKQEEKINRGFLFLNHHFPNGKIPQSVVWINSFFASNVFCTEHEIGVGLERYLGSQTDVIKELPSEQVFQWIKNGMKAEYLERDVLTAWIMTHYVPDSKDNMAAAIVRWGKIIYLTEASFPDMEKHTIMRYTQKQYQWASDNEYSFWKYLVDEKLLFSDNDREQSNLLNDGPFTMGLPEKGPDRLGQFLGWQMVHSYMNDYPETTLEELVKIPYTKILQTYEVK